MKGKRILSLVLAVMLVLGALPAGQLYAAAEDEAAVVFSVVPSRPTALPGSTITYTIYLEPVSHFNGLQFTLGLPDGLTLVEDNKNSTFYSKLHADYPNAKFDSSDQLIYLLYCFSPMDFSTTEELDLLSFTCAVSETCTGKQTIALNNVTVLNTANNKLPIVCDPDGSAVTVQTAGNGKAIQLVSGGAAANIAGAQQSNIWFGNYRQSGNKTDGFNGEAVTAEKSVTVESPKDDYTVQVKAFAKDGTLYTESEALTVKVDHTLWAKIVAVAKLSFTPVFNAMKKVVPSFFSFLIALIKAVATALVAVVKSVI